MVTISGSRSASIARAAASQRWMPEASPLEAGKLRPRLGGHERSA
jgi:hypothetical protein